MFKFNTKKLCLIAMFVALSVVVNSVVEITIAGDKRLTFTILLYTLAGLFTGAIGGAITGLLGDLLGTLLFTTYAPNPILSLTSMLTGLVFGLAFDLYKLFSKKDLKPIALIVITVLSHILVFALFTFLINSYAINTMIHKFKFFSSEYWSWLLIDRLPLQAINSLLNLILSCLLIVTLTRIPFFKEYLYVYKIKDEVKEQVKDQNDTATSCNNEDIR